jgi:DNA-binding transcriptional LysR family regulator
VVRTIYKTREDFDAREYSRLRTLRIGVADHLAVHFAPGWLKNVYPIVGERKIQLVTGLKAGLGFVELLKSRDLDFLLA